MKDNIENNIKIAEFLHRRGKDKKHLFWFYDERTGKSWHTAENLQFDTSWDWLMPVVEKMWEYTRHRHLFYQEIRWNDEDDVMDQQLRTIFPTRWPGKITVIEEVYSLVINFIDSKLIDKLKKR